jgi:hypothetical protein
MKRTFVYIFMILALGLSACEKVIYPDLSNGKTLLVIESRISTDSVPWRVKLSLTQDYFSTATPPAANGAVVSITDDLGNSIALVEDTGGYYKSAAIQQCVVGRRYTLNVSYKGTNYSASESCLFQEPIDSITYKFRPKQAFIPAGFYITEHAKEKEGAGDYYLWEIYKNDTLINDFGYFINDDAFVNGNYIVAEFPFNFKLYDSIRVDQFAISKQWYNFLITVESESRKSGTPFDTPPANAVSNIKGGALGYFAVLNLERRSLKILE